ncbi:hypothetical protein [Antarctobacter heliothermus]|uniref:Uncharacterized protein n=1 Tax=Antarctobacter heliothermus TaxID=74033 RepID=A0A239MFM5_9RHOB|nr:hypothetical protein [Antarctobacter heliothermus]SNT41461.1 hypothetical protein SAMN04488078_11582 [Antarctobacter heliothermus]
MGLFTAAKHPTTVDDVLSAFTQVVDNLDAVAVVNESISEELRQEALVAQSSSEAAAEEATKARRIGIKLREILQG